MKYRVKPGKELAHGGGVAVGGTTVELAPHIAHGVRHLVAEIGPDGTDVEITGTEQDAIRQSEIDRSLPHERPSLIRDAIAANLAHRTKLEAQLVAAEAEADKPGQLAERATREAATAQGAPVTEPAKAPAPKAGK